MGQHRDKVEYQALKLDAEEWAKGIKQIHVHGLTSLWYETKESIKDLEAGNVTDTIYNDGRIQRSQNGKVIRTFGEVLTGEDLVHEYGKYNLVGSNWAQLYDEN